MINTITDDPFYYNTLKGNQFNILSIKIEKVPLTK